MRVAISILFLCVTAACGDDGVNKLPDAPPVPDGAPDAPDAPVTLTITVGTTPVADVTVLFQNADSSLVSSTTTNAQGVASAVMAAGGFVTAINPFPNQPQPAGINTDQLRTFGGVKPGDQLKLNESGNGGTLVNVNVIVPIDATATFYTFWSSCGSQDITNGGGSGSGSGGPGGPITLFDCGATADIVIETFDASFVSLNSLVHTNVAISEGGTIDLSADTYAATVDRTFTYTNVPTGITQLNIFNLLVTPKGQLVNAFSGADVIAGGATATIKRPTVTDATSVTLTAFFNGALGRHNVLEWGPDGAYNLDAANLLLHEYGSFPVFDPAAHTTTWTSTNAVQPDFALVNMFFQRDDGTNQQFWDWQLVVPYTGTSVTWPVLPPAAGRFNPASLDNANLSELVTGKVPGGYDAVRPNVLSLNGPEALIVGPTGRVVFEELVQGKLRARGKKPSRFFPAPKHR